MLSGLRFIACIILLSPVAVYASDPFLGRWTLDVKQSKYSSECPKAMTITMSPATNGVHYHSETKWANGRSSIADYTANYEERSATVTGDRSIMLPVSLRRVAPNVVIANYSRGLKTFATSRRVVSKDGKVMTVTTSSEDAVGKTVVNVGVYRKEDGDSDADLSKIRLSPKPATAPPAGQGSDPAHTNP